MRFPGRNQRGPDTYPARSEQVTHDASRHGVVDDGNVAWPERVAEARRSWPQVAAALAALIEAHGPRSACWLATQVGRRKKLVLQALHLGRFVHVAKGRSSTWDNLPVAPVAFRDAVWRARSRGALDGIEGLELLLEPPPKVLAMLAESAA